MFQKINIRRWIKSNRFKFVLKARISSLLRSVPIVVVFAGIGFITLHGTHAATFATGAEAETGMVSGNASVTADANASGGSAVTFGVSAPVTDYGVPSGTSLTPSGSINATSGQIIQNLDITGQVFIGAGVHNVTIKNCRFNGNGSEYWAIETEGDGSATVDHVTIHGLFKDAAFSYSNLTVTNSDIYDMASDGAKIGNNVSYTHNWFHSFRPAQGAHADAMQIYEKVANVIIHSNIIDAQCASGYSCVWNANDALDQSMNSALILNDSTGTGTPGTVTVDNNTLAGGGFTVYFDLPGTTAFTNNKFIRNSYRWGALDDRAHALAWTNNTYSDNGEVLAMPGSN